jgi:hypothetical protein
VYQIAYRGASYTHIYQLAFKSGAIDEQVERYAYLVRQAHQERGLVDPNQFEPDVAEVLGFIAQRAACPGSTSLLGE